MVILAALNAASKSAVSDSDLSEIESASNIGELISKLIAQLSSQKPKYKINPKKAFMYNDVTGSYVSAFIIFELILK